MHLLNGQNDLVLLVLLFLERVKKVDLLESVLEALQLVQVENLNNVEHNHDWAHADLVLMLLSHLELCLLVSDSIENFQEIAAELLGHEVDKGENEE